MPSLQVYRSNRLERLADRLGELLRQPLPDPLQPETIVVQSLGMRRWLSLELARPLGVTMNCRFPFPATFAHEVFRSAFPEDVRDEESPFDRSLLPWRVLAALPGLLSREDCEPLRRYVAGEMGTLKSFQLAGQLASIFDRYLAYRPERLLRWGEGKRAADWQAQLWRALSQGFETIHPPALLWRLFERIERGEHSLPGLPPRISIFGISHLPPFFIDLIDVVACCVEVHLFLLEPTDQYWGDIQSPREQERILRRNAARGLTAEDLHLDTGNALLASLGKPGRAFARAIQKLEPNGFREDFELPADTTLLSRLQADIFALRDRLRPSADSSDDAGTDARPGIRGDDRSLQIHCCHGPMRELEVLHDQLLALFETLPNLTPKDILVTMPDVEPYAPLIEAVFGSPEDEAQRIPFTVADRSAKAGSTIARTFLQLLDLHGSRFGAASVLALLEAEPVRRRFEIAERDLDTIRDWVRRTGIRWGIDGAHRATFGLPAFEQNTWRAGLDRLLLGYALPGDGRTLFGDILPDPEIEGGLALLLGQFTDFAEKLFALIPALREPRTLGEWERALRHLLDTFFDDSGASADEITRLRRTLAGIGALEEIFAEPVPLEVIRAHVAQAFSDTESGGGYLAGHVTFCSLKPMRSIPFRVICMLGMNDGAFPRREPALAFDLLAGEPAPGDRSRRDDDRQLFLETLLSARDALYLSYCGLSSKDNTESPPSVVVSELLDYVADNFVAPDGKPLRNSLVARHRLQAFSPAYFRDGAHFSYSQENCRASATSVAAQLAAGGCIDAPLPPPDPGCSRVTLDQLIAFFCNPSKTFLHDRLGLRLPSDEAPLDECEPMSLDSLQRWQLQQDLAAALLSGGDAAGDLRLARARGTLPPSHAGETQFHKMRAALAGLAARKEAIVSAEPLPPLTVNLALEPWQLTGSIAGIWPAGRVEVIAWELKAKSRLRAWLAHLAMNAAGAARETFLLGTDCTVRIGAMPKEEAAAHLAELLALYGEGLCAPLPFFPKASFEFARRSLKPRDRERSSPASAARKAWETQEATDAHFDFCFRGCADPLDARWQDLALRIFQPMLTHASDQTT